MRLNSLVSCSFLRRSCSASKPLIFGSDPWGARTCITQKPNDQHDRLQATSNSTLIKTLLTKKSTFRQSLRKYSNVLSQWVNLSLMFYQITYKILSLRTDYNSELQIGRCQSFNFVKPLPKGLSPSMSFMTYHVTLRWSCHMSNTSG